MVLTDGLLLRIESQRVDRWTMATEDIQNLRPRTVKVTLYDNRDFTYVIKLKIL